MTTYLISLFSPDGPPPADLDLGQVMADLEVVNADIRAAGGWVFAGGLGDQASATTIRRRRGGADAVVTDGPFAEAKEHLGGISVVRSDDYDVVLGWADRIAGATGLPVEVRPFQGEEEPGQAPTDGAARSLSDRR
ncbi:YciI family protein [Terrabacter terrae]|uniref:YciI family protein n=1 Tax=Terrabacter terrae TaxID=318434 RepID=A0ABN1ZUH7_9MICO